MVDTGRPFRPNLVFEPGHRARMRGPAADSEPAVPESMAKPLDPAAQVIADLYHACRLDGERYAECFARLGAPRYAAMLREALRRAA